MVAFKALSLNDAKMVKDAEKKAIREFCKNLLGLYLDSPDKIKKAANATGLSYQTVEQAKIYGKGSTDTFGLLICYGLGIRPKDLPEKARQFYSEVDSKKSLNQLEKEISNLRMFHNVDDIIIWLKLLQTKMDLENKMKSK